MSRGSLLNASIGDYRLVSFLGAGGMGEVYRAVHVKLDRAVAIKLLTLGTGDQGFLQRFWNEARLHASLHHPNIAELYDFLEHDGRPCIVMEYVDGHTLSDRIASGPCPIDEAIRIFQAVVAAMAYVHEQGIVHRDLKAANVRISSRGVVKLLDFGIAKGGTTPSLTMAGLVIGTLLYMAPEQHLGEPATPRSDVWSLGVLLYEMVTGRPPFRADAFGELVAKLSSGTYESPATVLASSRAADPAVLRDLDRVVGRCLRKSPGDRYASAGELLQDVMSLGAARPAVVVRADPVDPAERADLAEPAPAPGGSAALDSLFGRRGLAVAVVATAVVLAALGYGLWPASDRPGLPVAGQATPAATPLSRPAPEPGKTVHRIDVVEGRAEVFVNGARRGTTPFDYQAARGETMRLELRQEGFLPYAETFAVTDRSVWTFSMRREAPGRRQ